MFDLRARGCGFGGLTQTWPGATPGIKSAARRVCTSDVTSRHQRRFVGDAFDKFIHSYEIRTADSGSTTKITLGYQLSNE